MKLQNDFNSPYFTSRCPEIIDSQWVNNTVNRYKHISNSQLRRRIEHISINNGLLSEGESIHALKYLITVAPKCKKISRLYNFYNKIAAKVNEVREDWQNGPMPGSKIFTHIVKQLSKDKYANCGETAFMAACIARMNNMKNAYIAKLATGGEKLNHVVCVINRDGSEFDGKIKPHQTIIIDPWFNKTDFAGTMFKEYSTHLSNYLRVSKDAKIELLKDSITPIDLNGIEILVLRSQFPEFTFPYKGREFMHRNTKGTLK